MKWAEVREKLLRRAVLLQVGGFRPSGDPIESWIGAVKVALPTEVWPLSAGTPLAPLCQLNLTTMPYRPQLLADLALITVFIHPDNIPDDTPNGEGWCLRTYRSLDGLVPVQMPQLSTPFRPFSLKPSVVDDFPGYEEVAIELPSELEDQYSDVFETVNGLKVGGWPSLIQSEIYWAPYNKHPAEPAFAFQIDSDEKAQMAWGDSGVLYFGRGTKAGHEDEWAFSWQCA